MRKAKSALILAILFVSAIAETVNVTGQVTNLTSANIVTALGSNEIGQDTPQRVPGIPYNYLFIKGSVNNTGESTAYNAGLKVVAYNATGGLLIDMTVPLSIEAIFGTDAEIVAWISHYKREHSTQLGTLQGGDTVPIKIGIAHEGIVTNWTITPVWTTSPNPTVTFTVDTTPPNVSINSPVCCWRVD